MQINLSEISKIYLIWLLSIVLIFLVAIFWKYSETELSLGIIRTLESWDGGYFLNISENGYTQNYQFVFLPLYPLILRLLNNLFLINGAILGFLVNALLLFGFVKVFHLLIKRDYDEKTAIKVISLFLLYPVSFFLLLPYSESLFIFLVGLFFLLLSKNRIWGTLLILFLSLFTRISGLFLLPVIFFEIIYSKKYPKYFLILPLLLILAFFYYFYINTGNIWINFHAETLYWKRELGFPGMGIINGIKEVILEPNKPINYLNILAVIFGVGLFIRSIKLLKKEYVIYTFTGMFFYLMLTSLVSFPRFLIVLFPLFISLGLIKNKVFTVSYIVFSILMTIINICLFVNGNFVS